MLHVNFKKIMLGFVLLSLVGGNANAILPEIRSSWEFVGGNGETLKGNQIGQALRSEAAYVQVRKAFEEPKEESAPGTLAKLRGCVYNGASYAGSKAAKGASYAGMILKEEVAPRAIGGVAAVGAGLILGAGMSVAGVTRVATAVSYAGSEYVADVAWNHAKSEAAKVSENSKKIWARILGDDAQPEVHGNAQQAAQSPRESTASLGAVIGGSVDVIVSGLTAGVCKIVQGVSWGLNWLTQSSTTLDYAKTNASRVASTYNKVTDAFKGWFSSGASKVDDSIGLHGVFGLAAAAA